jgi:hypothetical protein
VREAPRTVPAGPAAPLEPIGELSAFPVAFRWVPDPAADAYRLDVFDAEGRFLVGAMTRDTAASFASLGIGPLRAGSWRVVPLGADGNERRGHPAVSFHVR